MHKIGFQAFGRGKFFAAIVLFFLLPFSRVANPGEEKHLHTDLYVMF
jgi:hypothetical protein